MSQIKSSLHRSLQRPARRLHPLALALLSCCAATAYAASPSNPLPTASIPLAGSVISNMAIGEYVEEGSTVVQTSRSNLVETTIIPTYAFRLEANRSLEGVAGQMVYFSHQLTNSGNVADRYQLSVVDPAGGIEYADEAIYLDRNRDGLPDGAALSLAQLADINLQSGETLGLLVGATIPLGTAAASYANSLQISATSTGDNTLPTLSNNDSVIVSGNAVIRVRKAFSVAQAPNGSIVTVRLVYENLSSVSSGQVTITDDLSAGTLQYQSNTGTWSEGSTVTDAAGGDSAGLNYEYNGTTQTLTAILNNIPANSTGVISFNVAINSAQAGDIPNLAGVVYDPDNNAGTPNNVTTTSNTAVVNVPAIYSVVINAISGSASQAPADNLQTVPSVNQGGIATFQNYVWNTGNSTDTFNLTTASNNLPVGSVVEFFRADGVTPILDSNGDGTPDTGPMAVGESYPIVVKVRFPTSQTDQPAQDYSVFPQAQSINSSSAVDTVEDRTNQIVSQLVDLANTLPASGVGNGNIDNAGAPLKTLSTSAGGRVIFPITVAHTGTPTRYTLAADADSNFNTLNLPAGVSVVFAESVGGSCATTGAIVGQTRALNDGEIQTLCAIVSVATGTAAATATPLFFRAFSPTYVSNGTGTPTNAGSDIIKNALTITNNAPAQLLFTPDLRGQIAAGGTIVYTHTIVNQGTTAVTDTQPFVVTNSQTGFTTTLYYDANDNGLFESTDPIITDLDSFSSNGANGLDAGESIRIFAKVQNDGTALLGSENNTLVRLLDGSSVELGRVLDITTMSNTLIRLTKMQALDANCDGTADSGTYTTATLPIQRNSDGQGQCVLYRLTVRNEGDTGIGAFNFRDTTPAGTTMRFAPSCASCTTTSAPAIGDVGSISGQVPSIAPSASYTFNFGVQYNGR